MKSPILGENILNRRIAHPTASRLDDALVVMHRSAVVPFPSENMLRFTLGHPDDPCKIISCPAMPRTPKCDKDAMYFSLYSHRVGCRARNEVQIYRIA